MIHDTARPASGLAPMWTGEAEFDRVAASFGHDLARLAAGETVVRDLRIPDHVAGRALLCRASDEVRRSRLASFFQPQIELRRRLGQGMHDRGEAVVWAAAPPEKGDRRGLSRHYPVRVRSISVREKRIAAGDSWNVSVRGEEWGVDRL